ncbi:hypothetical protein MNBD_BACTEROID03-408, partial [hydrothermal vent metagenome]
MGSSVVEFFKSGSIIFKLIKN